MSYVSPKEAVEYYKVSTQTLRQWNNNNKIKSKLTDGGHRRYFIPDQNIIRQDKRDRIIYARVSSKKQEEDLKRQVKYLQKKYPGYKVITDIGSGINFKRRGLNSILERLFNGTLEKVVVSHRDRLTRFGFEHFEYIFRRFKSSIVVENSEKETSYEKELVDDIMSIITVFTARYYGSRKYHVRKKNTILS